MFTKWFVRVESLALEKALSLRNEVGFTDLYLAYSDLIRESGYAKEMAQLHSMPLKRLGLSREEIGKFTPKSDEDGLSPGNPHIERMYQFHFNDQAHKISLIVFVMLAKITKDSDWELGVESVFKSTSGLYGSDTRLIYRDHRKPVK